MRSGPVDLRQVRALGVPALARLVQVLDAQVVGHARAKLALILGLVAREHVLLEGPPGCAKTLLAESFVRAAGEPEAALRFHRDTRVEHAFGEIVLQRRRRGNVERLREEWLPTSLVGARLLVLDDLDRAPAEALAPLLELLRARRFRGRSLALDMAIGVASTRASSGGARSTQAPVSAAEPLDPPLIDRFALRVRMRGLLSSGQRARMVELMELGPGTALSGMPEGLSSPELHDLRMRVEAIELPVALRARYVEWLEELRQLGAPVSDRGFGRAAPRLLRTSAALRGARVVEPGDLAVLDLLLPPGAARELAFAPDPPAGDELGDEPSEALPGSGRTAAAPGGRAPSAGALPALAEQRRDVLLASSDRERTAPLGADVGPLLRALRGRQERGHALPDPDPGGMPRRLRPLRRLDESGDADAVDLVGLVDGTQTSVRVYRRERRERSGRMAILRDVSRSMEGRVSRWAAEVVLGLVRSASRRRTRVGYVEFSHEAVRFAAGGRFFTRDYVALLEAARRAGPSGRTSYEAPLRLALDELERSPGRGGHVVLLTDGVPVAGDPEVQRERGRARKAGVRLHTVFLGVGERPALLQRIAEDTGGVHLVGRVRRGGRLHLEPPFPGPAPIGPARPGGPGGRAGGGVLERVE